MGKEQKTQTVRRLTRTLTEEEHRTKSEELTKLLREKAGNCQTPGAPAYDRAVYLNNIGGIEA